jgi:hypothetical protein
MLLSAYTLPVFRLFDLPLPEGGKSSWREHCPTPHCMSETLLQKYVFRGCTVANLLCFSHSASAFCFFQPHVAFRKHSSSSPSLRLATPGGWQVFLEGTLPDTPLHERNPSPEVCLPWLHCCQLALFLAFCFSLLFLPAACCFPQTLFQFSFDLPFPEGGKSSWREHCPTPHCRSETLLQKYVFRCCTVACCRCLFLSFLPSFFLSLSLSLSLFALLMLLLLLLFLFVTFLSSCYSSPLRSSPFPSFFPNRALRLKN